MNQKKVWNKIAGKWNEYKKEISPEVQDFLKGKKGNVLDVGCGSGRNFVKQSGLKISGVDFSKEMLKHARENADKKKIDVELKLIDVEKIPFDNESFDYVVCVAVLHCLKPREQKKVMKEIFRVLKKRGEVFISVWSRKSSRLKNKPKESFIPWTIGNTKQKRYNYIYEKSELEKQVRAAGFKVLKSWEDRNIGVVGGKLDNIKNIRSFSGTKWKKNLGEARAEG